MLVERDYLAVDNRIVRHRGQSTGLMPGLVAGGGPAAGHQIHQVEPGAVGVFQLLIQDDILGFLQASGDLGMPLANRGSTGVAKGVVLQLKSAKQLSVGGYDDGGQAHRHRPHTHGEIESPVDEKAGSNRNSDKVIGRRPNQVLDHLFDR